MIVELPSGIAYIEEAMPEKVPYALPTDVFSGNVTLDRVTMRGEPIVSEGEWGRIVASFYEAPIAGGWIDELEEGYVVLRPIPYTIERVADGNYAARFDEADIAINGWDQHDAYQALVAEILDSFDTLSAERRLSSNSARQFEILSGYIART